MASSGPPRHVPDNDRDGGTDHRRRGAATASAIAVANAASISVRHDQTGRQRTACTGAPEALAKGEVLTVHICNPQSDLPDWIRVPIGAFSDAGYARSQTILVAFQVKRNTSSSRFFSHLIRSHSSAFMA